MDFRERTTDYFAAVFGKSTEGSGIENGKDTAENQFAAKWGWFSIMHRLCNGNIINLNKITDLLLYECLTWLSYEADLNEIQNVKLQNDMI